MTETRIRIFYPADPVGTVPGGVDTFLRGLIKWAPADLAFSLVGMTTDTQARPPGRWTTCQLGDRTFEMFPACVVDDAGSRGRLPLSLRFVNGVSRDRLALADGFDVFDFHRIEPVLMWGQDQRPKNAFFHQDPNFVRQAASDAVWRHFPALYERLERAAVQQLSAAWCVRESGAQRLRERYPERASQVQFLPTWVDSETFHPVDTAQRERLRAALHATWGLDTAAAWIVSVGRLDTQKDPLRLAEAFGRLRASGQHVQWLVIGDGVLKGALHERLSADGLLPHVRFLGLQPPGCIANILPACDAYALSSAYEGMPMALLEALGCGLPAVGTDVGEVRRVLRDGVNGRVVPAGDAAALAQGLSDVLAHRQAWGGDAATAAVQPYAPATVLQPVYARYRELGQPLARLREAAEVREQAALNERRARRPVVGVPVDVGTLPEAVQRILDWGSRRESRTVCFVNVHSAVQATIDERHRRVLAAADLVTPDGAPIAWTLRVKGHRGQPRLDGPGTMWRLLEAAQAQQLPVGFYGSEPAVLQTLVQRLRAAFPALRVAYSHAPPFRELSADEREQDCREITSSGAVLLFVSLGCPKQEFWMAAHRDRLPCVMLGVGAAFDYHAGTLSRAPAWMRRCGLEWLYRLLHEPRRLWRRYTLTNSVFLAKSLAEAARSALDWLLARPSAPER
jgi:exopolysaccharide biosynthesis WecB/TagA/CpsF family protein